LQLLHGLIWELPTRLSTRTCNLGDGDREIDLVSEMDYARRGDARSQLRAGPRHVPVAALSQSYIS